MFVAIIEDIKESGLLFKKQELFVRIGCCDYRTIELDRNLSGNYNIGDTINVKTNIPNMYRNDFLNIKPEQIQEIWIKK